MRGPGTVLVVDDEPTLLAILQEFLQLHGFTVVTAASGEEAIQQVERQSPAVALLDFQLSGMDGLVTLRKLKSLRPDLVVIMMTGLDEEQLMADALKLGAHDYIMKPFDLEYLESTLLTKVLLGKTP
jgi:DNA-binding response OmpR family regulator